MFRAQGSGISIADGTTIVLAESDHEGKYYQEATEVRKALSISETEGGCLDKQLDT